MEVWKLKPKYKGLQKKKKPWNPTLQESVRKQTPYTFVWSHFFFLLLFLNLSNVHSVNDGLI